MVGRGIARSRIIGIFTITSQGRKASELVKLGRYDWLRGEITDSRFPIQPHGLTTRTIELVECDYELGSEDVLEELAYHGLRRPTYEDGLEFGVQHPDEQRKRPIAFHHIYVFGPGVRRYILVLHGNTDGRGLVLGWLDRKWPPRYLFAGLRE